MSDPKNNTGHGRNDNINVVLRCICDLTESKRVATRQTIINATKLKFFQVDDAVKALLESGRISRPMPGVFEPLVMTPDRATSVLETPGGRVKIEVGDTCMEVTQREARSLGKQLAGYAFTFGS